MSRRKKELLRPLTEQERVELTRVSRAGNDRADRVARAKALIAVADGGRYKDAAAVAGWRVGDTVGRLVSRFNKLGLAALDRQHGGGPEVRYRATERERILKEFRRQPDREQDGTATWSLTTLQRALRTAADGLPQVSTMTILFTLWDAGYSWQDNRTWCQTGTVVRRRKSGLVAVTDPDTAPKKS